MMLTTKGKYGLRAVLEIAVHEGAVSVSTIAAKQRISEAYLEKLISLLKKAGIVNSVRGAQGGYVLAKDASLISVGDILRALEGNLNPIGCALIDETVSCEGEETCVTKYVWKRISDSISAAVDGLMLSDLVRDGKRMTHE